MIDPARLRLYREDIVSFAEDHFWIRDHDGSVHPIRLAEHQKRILRAMFTPDADGYLPSEVVWSCPKKSGKTCVGALIAKYLAFVYTPEGAEVIIAANSREQATARVFADVLRSVRSNPATRTPPRRGRPGTEILRDSITLPTGVRIAVISSEYGTAAGSRHSCAVFDELWNFTTEADRRLYEELTPIPTLDVSMRVVVSYAGFQGEGDLLRDMVDRGMRGERVFDDLPVWRNGGLVVYYDSGTDAWRMPWQSGPRWESYISRQRQELRPNQFRRLHLNEFTGNESALFTAEQWDSCVDAGHAPVAAGKRAPVFVAVDLGVKNDTSAVVGVTPNLELDTVDLAFARKWAPTPGGEVDLDAVESYIRWIYESYALIGALYDPWQATAIAQRLSAFGVPMIEFPQTPQNQTLASQALLDVVRGRRLRLYPDADLREHALNAVAVENTRGWRIAKEKSSAKIDLVVALSFAVYGMTSLSVQVPDEPLEDYLVTVSPI